MAKKRVMPFGIGKAFVTIKMGELPKDIQEGLIELHSKRTDEYRITEDTVNVVLCGDVMSRN